jgi:hypothetical protein
MMREISSSANKSLAVSNRLYRLLLAAYPAEFRHEYGAHMAQVFRDRCREEQGRRRGVGGSAGLARVWMETILDLARTAPEEHLHNAGRGVRLMKALLKIAAALVAYAVLFMLAGKFLASTREHLPFLVGTLLDSLIAIGILFNFLVLIFVNTGWLAAKRAVIISGIITSVLVIAMVSAIALSQPVNGRPNGAAIMGLVLSFLLWFGVHWLWAQRKNQTQAAT